MAVQARWLLSIVSLLLCCLAAAQDPPIRDPADEGRGPRPGNILNLFTPQQIHDAISGGEDGLTLDLRQTKAALPDGTPIDGSAIYGMAHMGPFPFESEEATFAYKRFHDDAEALVADGKAVLPVRELLVPTQNSEGWTDMGQVVVRLDLYLAQEGPDVHLGDYDIFVIFRSTATGVERLPSLIEGPFVNLVTSEDPGSVLITCRTDREVPVRVAVQGRDGVTVLAESPFQRRHELAIRGLRPDSEYGYRVTVGEYTTREYRFRTAPEAGEGEFLFAYTGDSRQGEYGGESSLMGTNHKTLERLAAMAHQRRVRFFLQGGDLFNGYTSDVEDFRTQFYSWKQSLAGLWPQVPVLTALGNHEALLRGYEDDRWLQFDRWPYETESAEAVFADEVWQPANGPEPSDARRPPYKETAFSFAYGPVRVICFNNNYWLGTQYAQWGGCPEGYVFQDQIDWVVSEIELADRDPNVKYTFVMAQEPVFPCGGHLKDAMWYHGDNNVTAYTYTDGELVPEPMGIVESRDALAKAITGSPKVAAVLGSDEHAYWRLLIAPEVPIGNLEVDDTDGDGILDTLSTVDWIRHPTWFITSGGAGAPHSSEEPAPWTDYWAERESRNSLYSSQENIVFFRVRADGVSAEVRTPYGELLDYVGNLMDVKAAPR